jgi:hypothetical protein
MRWVLGGGGKEGGEESGGGGCVYIVREGKGREFFY